MKKLLSFTFLLFIVCISYGQSSHLESDNCESLVFHTMEKNMEEKLILLEVEVAKDTWIKHSVRTLETDRSYFDELKSGVYRVTTINSQSRDISNSVELKCREDRQITINNSFNISPNPNNGRFDIVVNSQFDSPLTCQIYNIDGVLLSDNILSKRVTSLSIQDLTDGIYVVAIYNQNRLLETQKLIIQKN